MTVQAAEGAVAEERILADNAAVNVRVLFISAAPLIEPIDSVPFRIACVGLEVSSR